MAEDEPAEREEPDAGESEPAGDAEPDDPTTEPASDTDEEPPVQPADESPMEGSNRPSADSRDEPPEIATDEEETEQAAGTPDEPADADLHDSLGDIQEEPTEEGPDQVSDEPIRVRPAPTEPIPRPPSSMLPTQRSVNAPIGAVRELIRALSSAREGEEDGVPEDVRKYDRFKKVDGAQYERVNEFLRERTYITAREWAIARLCADFRTETGVEMTKIGENLPHLVPFMTDTYSPQAVNQARSSFETKVKKSGATFLYGAMSDFFSADELDEVMYEVTEVAKFLLEVEGVDLAVDEELEGEERISSVMREVRSASDELRHEGTTCPNCGHEIGHD